MELSFHEIADWRTFEHLIAAFFRTAPEREESVKLVSVQQTGVGADDGRDILVSLTIDDSISVFERKYVVQAKFYEKNVSTSDISDVNIPSLIHEYGADGYILICKGDFTSKLTKMFEQLNKNCKFGYEYQCWSGDMFLLVLRALEVTHPIFRQYFSLFYQSQK